MLEADGQKSMNNNKLKNENKSHRSTDDYFYVTHVIRGDRIEKKSLYDYKKKIDVCTKLFFKDLELLKTYFSCNSLPSLFNSILTVVSFTEKSNHIFSHKSHAHDCQPKNYLVILKFEG